MNSTRCCSHCGSNGHNSRTCRLSSASSSSGSGSCVIDADGGDIGGDMMLLGVRINEDPMRKSVSMNKLSQYEHTNNVLLKGLGDMNVVDDLANKVADDVAGSYASADDAVPLLGTGSREHKRDLSYMRRSAIPIGYLIRLETAKPSTHVYEYYYPGWMKKIYIVKKKYIYS